MNSSGEYACNQSGSGGAWSCQKLGQADAATENKIFDFYTPSHWVSFLKGVSLVAGLAGDKVTSSTMSLNGFDMNCVDLVAHGVPGTSTICSTSQGILGYVKVASDSTSFQITSYSSSPDPSLFQLPPGPRSRRPRPSAPPAGVRQNEGMTTFITRYETSGPVSAWPSRTSSTWRGSDDGRLSRRGAPSRAGGPGRRLPPGPGRRAPASSAAPTSTSWLSA